MFDPINKTISQLRDEVVNNIGMQVPIVDGKVTIVEVTELYTDTEEFPDKMMYGFTVTVCATNKGEKIYQNEKILVPVEAKDSKMSLGNLPKSVKKIKNEDTN